MLPIKYIIKIIPLTRHFVKFLIHQKFDNSFNGKIEKIPPRRKYQILEKLVKYSDAFDMMCLREHVDRLDFLDIEASFSEKFDVPDHGDRIAGDI